MAYERLARTCKAHSMATLPPAPSWVRRVVLGHAWQQRRAGLIESFDRASAERPRVISQRGHGRGAGQVHSSENCYF